MSGIMLFHNRLDRDPHVKHMVTALNHFVAQSSLGQNFVSFKSRWREDYPDQAPYLVLLHRNNPEFDNASAALNARPGIHCLPISNCDNAQIFGNGGGVTCLNVLLGHGVIQEALQWWAPAFSEPFDRFKLKLKDLYPSRISKLASVWRDLCVDLRFETQVLLTKGDPDDPTQQQQVLSTLRHKYHPETCRGDEVDHYRLYRRFLWGATRDQQQQMRDIMDTSSSVSDLVRDWEAFLKGHRLSYPKGGALACCLDSFLSPADMAPKQFPRLLMQAQEEASQVLNMLEQQPRARAAALISWCETADFIRHKLPNLAYKTREEQLTQIEALGLLLERVLSDSRSLPGFRPKATYPPREEAIIALFDSLPALDADAYGEAMISFDLLFGELTAMVIKKDRLFFGDFFQKEMIS